MRSAQILSIIIVNYNTHEVTLGCLSALFQDLGTLAADVWVVDNASKDGSVAAIRAEFPQVHLIKNEHNVGFGAANNQAMAIGSGEFFLLLNSDALLKKGTIGVLIDYIKKHPEVAAVGPRIINPDGSLQLSCFRFPSPLLAWSENLWIAKLFPNHPIFGNYRGWAHDSERLVDYVIGACMLVRREAYDQVGGFDEQFFMYAEESDWQKRMAEKRWRIGFTPAAEVVHAAGTSSEAGINTQRNYYFYRGLDYYYWKHYGVLGLVSFRLATVVGSFLRLIGWALVTVCIPKLRESALLKFRLYLWLFFRESMYWKLDWKAL